jgi:hypothetical protein
MVPAATVAAATVPGSGGAARAPSARRGSAPPELVELCRKPVMQRLLLLAQSR